MVERWINSAMMSKDELKKQVMSFSDLVENWDSYGGAPLPQKTIEKALEVLEWLPEVEHWVAVPGSDGSIQFESTKDNGLTVEVVAQDNL